MKESYVNQVNLLLDVLPHVMEDSRFALKGGTKRKCSKLA